ncbi:RAD55 family ATPase [[Eubacterium] cellulosolvens]
MDKIKSGVYGLNPLLDGGINEHSTTCVIGASGAGKTTFALQFIMRGMEVGQDGVFISLDENQKQIIIEAEAMGFTNIHKFIKEEKLVFIDASGEQFSNFIKVELPDFINEWKGTKSRIVIDPLTPVLWAVKERYEQRELISFLLKEARKVGTVLSTLEEHGPRGDLSTPETIIPMYIADCIIHLKYQTSGDNITRNLRIVKCRSSSHSEKSHPYRIVGGIGVIVQHDEFPAPKTTKISKRLFSQFNDLSKKLPREVRLRVSRAFSGLTDYDLRNIDPNILLEDIAEEYIE